MGRHSPEEGLLEIEVQVPGEALSNHQVDAVRFELRKEPAEMAPGPVLLEGT